MERTDATATELAMLDLIDNVVDVDINAVRKKYLTPDKTRFQFTSKRKKMSTVLEGVDDTSNGSGHRLHTKGAAEIVLRLCTHYIDSAGMRSQLSDAAMDSIID